jgi:hypothetical protein
MFACVSQKVIAAFIANTPNVISNNYHLTVECISGQISEFSLPSTEYRRLKKPQKRERFAYSEIILLFGNAR